MENKPNFQAGDNFLKLSDMQALVRMIPRVIRGGQGIKIRAFGDRILIEATANQAPPSGGSKIAQFQILEEKDDYLSCIRYPADPQASPEDIPVYAVAKPYLLQRLPFHGFSTDYGRASILYTYDDDGVGTRTARVMTIDSEDDNMEETDVGTVEAQIITPPYFEGEVILAVQMDTGLRDEEDKAISWADLNTGARCWTHNSRHDPDNPNAP
jgi:hypothetical protein